MKRADVNRAMCKLRLLQHGLLLEAEQLDEIGLERVGRDHKDDESEDESEEADAVISSLIERRARFVKRAIRSGATKRSSWTIDKVTAVADERKAVISEFMSEVGKSKYCASCKG